MPPFKRIRLSDIIGFLSRIPVTAYIVLIGVLGGLLYAGCHLEHWGKTALPTTTTVQHQRGEPATKNERPEKGTTLAQNTDYVNSELREHKKSLETTLHGRE